MGKGEFRMKKFYKSFINLDPPYVKKAHNYIKMLLLRKTIEICISLYQNVIENGLSHMIYVH